MRQLCGCMGWGLRVDREGNLHDTFPAPGEPVCWPRTPWHVKVRRPRKRLARGRRLLRGTLGAGKRLIQACRPMRVSRAGRVRRGWAGRERRVRLREGRRGAPRGQTARRA